MHIYIYIYIHTYITVIPYVLKASALDGAEEEETRSYYVGMPRYTYIYIYIYV